MSNRVTLLVTISVILLNITFGQLVVEKSIPDNSNYLDFYTTAVDQYKNEDYHKTKVYLELALADKR